MLRRLITVMVLFLLTYSINAQCCMPGNPSGGTTNQGSLLPKDLRVVAFYQFSNGSHFFTGSQKQNYNYIEGAHYHFTGLSVAYGINPKYTIELETGYFNNRTIRYSKQGLKDNPVNHSKGWGDFSFLNKYTLYKNRLNHWEFTPMIGFRIPTHLHPKTFEGEILPIDLQTSTQSFGLTGGLFVYKGLGNKKTHLFLNNRITYSFPNFDKYQFGVTWNSALFVSHNLNHRFTFIGQIRNEWRQKDSKNGYFKDATGSDVVLLIPQINFSVTQKWNFSILAEVPVYHYYIGTQLARSFSLAFVLNRLFRF